MTLEQVFLTIVLGLGCALVYDVAKSWWSRRGEHREIAKVRASFEREFTEGQSGFCRGATLVVFNGTVHPIRDVMVLRPEEIESGWFEYIAPGERKTLSYSAEQAERVPYSIPLTMQVVDWRGRSWHWTPDTGVIQPTWEDDRSIHTRVWSRLTSLLPRPLGTFLSACILLFSPTMLLFLEGEDYESGFKWTDRKSGRRPPENSYLRQGFGTRWRHTLLRPNLAREVFRSAREERAEAAKRKGLLE